jgi:hypothetical protein
MSPDSAIPLTWKTASPSMRRTAFYATRLISFLIFVGFMACVLQTMVGW